MCSRCDVDCRTAHSVRVDRHWSLAFSCLISTHSLQDEPEDRAAHKQIYRDAEQVKWMQACASELFTGISGTTARRKSRKQGDVSLHDHGAEQVDEQDFLSIDWDLNADRKAVWDEMNDNARLFHRWLTKGPISRKLAEFGLTLSSSAPPSVYRTWDGKTPSVEIHSIRTAQRSGIRGEMTTDLVVEVCQRRRGYFEDSVVPQSTPFSSASVA